MDNWKLRNGTVVILVKTHNNHIKHKHGIDIPQIKQITTDPDRIFANQSKRMFFFRKEYDGQDYVVITQYDRTKKQHFIITSFISTNAFVGNKCVYQKNKRS